MEWASLRDPEGDYLTVVRAPKGATCDDLREIGEKYEAEVCFIDTPGHHSPEIATLIKGCDGVIIPVKPRMFDQLSSSKTIKTLLETTSGDRILVVINETSPPRGIMEAPAVVETRKYYQTLYPDVTVAQTAIVKREIYDIAIRNGMSAIELEPGGQGAIDLRRLWIEIRNYFNIQPARGT